MLRVFFAMVASAAFGVIFQVRGKNILFAGLSGGVGFFVYLFMYPTSGFAASFLASAAISIYAEFMARRRKTPSTMFLIAGLIPIVPGGGMYNCTLRALEGNLYEAAVIGSQTVVEAGAIAVGIIAVSSIVKLIPRKKIPSNKPA